MLLSYARGSLEFIFDFKSSGRDDRNYTVLTLIMFMSNAEWPHLKKTKFYEFSLRFPGHFTIFPCATQREKNSM